ncbi:hypothetical protein PDIDSM_7506 [Penicillium digitatum]|nr:hypothetical protein PDIDSM_7506 [Penicillium digitatum]
MTAQSDKSNTSNISRSTQSRQSVGSQYANKSPSSSRNSRLSSSGLTGLVGAMIGKLPSGSRSPKDIQMAGLDDQTESPDLLTSPETASEISLTPGSQPHVLQKKRSPSILGCKELEGTRFGYIANKWTAPILDPNSKEYPNLTTVVRVLQGDTYDRALEMQDTGSTSDPMPICVLNFANAFHPGGGWLRGARSQEEQICYRNTLIDTLHTRFYPMDDLEALYSPM